MRRFMEDFKMKKYFAIFSFLILSSTVFASTVGGSIGGWNVVSNVANGIGAKLTATKEVMINGASKVVTGTANITPKFTDVGRFMGRVGAAAVVTEAVNQLLDGVDWVMDPANNSVKFYEKVQDQKCEASTCASLLNIFKINNYDNAGTFSSAQVAASYYVDHFLSGIKDIQSWSCPQVAWNRYACTVNAKNEAGYNIVVNIDIVQVTNPNYDQSKEEERKKTVPLTEIGQQVIDQAQEDIKAGNVASPAVTLSRAVAQDMIQEAETDDTKARPIATELDKNISYPSDTDTDGTVTTPEVIDPVTGEVVKPAETSSISMKFPKACEWFPQACLFIDWAMTDPSVDSDMEVPEKEIDKQEIKKDLVKISGRSCPSDVKFDVDGLPFGIKINKAYSMQEICNTVEPLKYVFELITAVICALILLRV